MVPVLKKLAPTDLPPEILSLPALVKAELRESETWKSPPVHWNIEPGRFIIRPPAPADRLPPSSNTWPVPLPLICPAKVVWLPPVMSRVAALLTINVVLEQ